MYINLQEYSEFSKPEFTGDAIEVQIPRRIRTVSLADGICRIELEALICDKQPLVISALMQGRTFRFTGRWAEMLMQLSFTAEDALRVQLCDGKKMPVKHQPMLIEEPAPCTQAQLIETDAAWEFSRGDVCAKLYKDPYRMEVYCKGKLLYRQYNDDLHNVSNDRRRGHKEGEDDDASVQQESLSFPGFECFPFGRVRNTQTGESCFCESVETRYDEQFYGFGERFSPLNKRGQELLNWVINPVGVSNAKAYKVVPFFYSSRGYGVYYNTPRKIRFSMCDYFFKAYESQVQDDLLDLFLFVGDAKRVLRAYSKLTGFSAVPPKWAFGVWMSRNCYMTQDEVKQVAHQLRDEKLACDVMHIDWAYCKTYDYDFAFDPARFPDVPKLAQTLLDMGIKLSVWQLPYIKRTADTYAEAEPLGYLAKEADGATADTQAGEGVIDLSNPEAAAWYQDKLRNLLGHGIRVIKTDFGENAQESYLYQNCDGRDMHNLYPLYYNRLAYEVCQEVWPDDALVWGRSAYAGCQRYPVYWGGDSDSDYNGMYHSLRGGLSLGLSGFPFWSHDVGGYFCTPEPNVYIRWLQFGMLSPLVRFHGTSAREPWAFGEQAVQQYRRYAALRYSLMEYLYSEANHCAAHALPMLRALVLEFPDDPAAREIDDCYLLGSNILVAPVFSDDPVRMVYLPAGTAWLDLHSHVWYGGGKTVAIETPIDVTPVFLRGETATPFIAPMQYVDEQPVTQIRWEICPVHNIAYYDLDTDHFQMQFRYDFDGTTGTARICYPELEGLEQSLHINCPDVKKIYINGVDTPFDYEENHFVTVTTNR